MFNRKPKIVDISTMSEEALIHSIIKEEEQNMLYRKAMVLPMIYLGVSTIFGLIYFSGVLVPEMVEAWYGLTQ